MACLTSFVVALDDDKISFLLNSNCSTLISTLSNFLVNVRTALSPPDRTDSIISSTEPFNFSLGEYFLEKAFFLE